jgi:hypothetical protein
MRHFEVVRVHGCGGLKAAKAGGMRRGNPRLSEAQARGMASTKAAADQFAANMLPVIREIQKEGAASASQLFSATAEDSLGVAPYLSQRSV